MITSGMKSSEFWMTMVAAILKMFAPALGAEFPDEAMLAVAAYVVSRGLAKYQVKP